MRARFRPSGLLGPFSAQSEHLLYYEVGLNDIDLLCFDLERFRDHFCESTTPLFFSQSGLGFAVSQSIREFLHKGVPTMRYCKNFAVVASIELKLCLCARFRVSGLLGPFSAQLEHLL